MTAYSSFKRITSSNVNPMHAKLIGKIVLARFLERSSVSILAAVKNAEKIVRRHGLFDGPAPAIRRTVGSKRWHEKGDDADPVFAHIRIRREKPVLVWRSIFFACEYTVDDARLAECLAGRGDIRSETILRAVRILLLVTTRNRIAHEAARALIIAQSGFLRTGDESRLTPLTISQIAQAARLRGASAADTSRVSRLLRSTIVLLPDGSRGALRAICPTSRTVLRALVLAVLERERVLRARGTLRHAWTDIEIARFIHKRSGIRAARRLVGYCRKSLGAPSALVRSRRGCYMGATMGFSTLAPLKHATITDRVPATPGIYELRIAAGDPSHDSRCAGIIYVGKAKNLRRRLLAHASPNGRNGRLAEYVRTARVFFRYRNEKRDLKPAEMDIYRRFRETYGRAPECNKVSP